MAYGVYRNDPTRDARPTRRSRLAWPWIAVALCAALAAAPGYPAPAAPAAPVGGTPQVPAGGSPRASGASAPEARSASERLVALLSADGFENLSVEQDADGRTLRVLFENRRYRWEVDGLGVLLATCTREWQGRVVAVPMYTDVPVARIEVEAVDYRAFLNGELSQDEIFKRMKITAGESVVPAQLYNASIGRLDLAFGPGLRMNLATPAPPGAFTGAEIRANTTASVCLRAGLAAEATYVYPLSNSPSAFMRAAATWNARMGRGGFLQLQGGRLTHETDGIAAQASYQSDNGQHRAALAVAQAGRRGWKRTSSYQLSYSWRPETADVVATLSGGRYLRGDRGYSISLFNGFAENSVEFYYTTTTLSRTTGVVLTTPLGGRRWPRPTAVRAHLRDSFGFAYTDERPYPLGGGIAVPFNDNYQIAVRRWTRAYLRAYARELRAAGRRWVPASAEADAE